MPHSTRRAFFGVSAAALATTALPRPALAKDEQPGDLKLGVASYSFRKLSRAQAIDALKQLNVTYINIKEFHLPLTASPEEIAAARKEFTDAGIRIVGGGNIDMKKPELLRRNFQYAKLAGMPLMVIAPTQETMPEIEKLAKEFDIKIAIHNHGPEDKFFPTPQSVLKVVKDMDPRCGLCMDVGHTVRTGADIVESAREAGSRLLDLHVKDLRNLSDAKSQVAVGDGNIPIVALFKQLKKMNYQGYVNLEYEIEADNPLPGMQKSFAYMRGVLAGMRG